jgi:hypothetical protein
MRIFWSSSEGVVEYRDGVIIGESIGFDEASTRDITEEELVDPVRVISWLRYRNQVSDDERSGYDGPSMRVEKGEHTVKTGITALRAGRS